MKARLSGIFSVLVVLICLTALFSGCAVNPDRDVVPNQTTTDVNYTDNYNPGTGTTTVTPGGVPGVTDNEGVITPVPTTTAPR